MDTLLDSNRDIISRYTGQPSRLPLELRAQVEAAFGGEPILIYALADLDAELRLTEAWLAISQGHVAYASPGLGGGVQVVARGTASPRCASRRASRPARSR